jgi:hypothetical protein
MKNPQDIIEEKIKEYYEWMDEHGFRTDTSGSRKSLEYWISVMQELLSTPLGKN